MNITLDEIRSKAPEGATHYKMSRCLKNTAMYFKYSDGKYTQWNFMGWGRPFPDTKNEIKPL